MNAVGRGNEYNEDLFRCSIETYPFVALVSSIDGKLLGYISAFSDGAFSAKLVELAVHPDAQRLGIGRVIISAVEYVHRNIPVYVKPLGKAKDFFLTCGYKFPATEMTVLYNRNVD